MSLLLFLAIKVKHSTMKLMKFSIIILCLFANFQHFVSTSEKWADEDFNDILDMFSFRQGHNRMRCPPMYTNRGSKNDNLCLRFENQSTTITYIYTTCF